MRILHFDLQSGISGDMAVGALAHLGAPLEPLKQAMRSMGFPAVGLALVPDETSGIQGLRFQVDAAPGDAHHHRTFADILAALSAADMPDPARARAIGMFRHLAEAEGAVHGIAPERVAFHEVGAVDSIADIVGVALALDHLRPDRVTASEVPLGSGVIECQHGPLPLPAPATLELLRGIPVRGLAVEAELTTPTGAAVLRAGVDRFGPWPNMRPQAIGYGLGTKMLPGRPNLLRAVLGEAVEGLGEDEVLVETNIDDMNPEHFEHLVERLFEGGAHDVWLQAIQMKKCRPATRLSLLCDRSALGTLEEILFRESTTIGLRRISVERRKLARRQVAVVTPFGPVNVKVSGEGGRDLTAAPEYEDCRRHALAARVPLREVYTAAFDAYRASQREES